LNSADIPPTVRHGIAEKVFPRRQHALAPVLALQSTNKGGANRGGEIGIFTVCLLHPPPAGIPREIEIWRAGLMNAKRAHLASRNVIHGLDRERIPRRGKGNRGREVGASLMHEPRQRFVMHDRRNAQPRPFDQEALNLIQHLNQLCRVR
jgi:hypothetical protein